MAKATVFLHQWGKKISKSNAFNDASQIIMPFLGSWYKYFTKSFIDVILDPITLVQVYKIFISIATAFILIIFTFSSYELLFYQFTAYYHMQIDSKVMPKYSRGIAVRTYTENRTKDGKSKTFRVASPHPWPNSVVSYVLTIGCKNHSREISMAPRLKIICGIKGGYEIVSSFQFQINYLQQSPVEWEAYLLNH